jgi:hypothetical protein
MLTFEIRTNHVQRVPAATAQLGRCENVDYQAMRLSNVDTPTARPHARDPEHLAFIDNPQHETNAGSNALLSSLRLCRDDNDRVENLFGQVPVLGGCPSRDIAGREEGHRERERVIDGRFRRDQTQAHHGINTSPYADEPPFRRQARKHLVGMGWDERLHFTHVGTRDREFL